MGDDSMRKLSCLLELSIEQLQQFAEETIEELLKELPVERILRGLPVEKFLKGLSPDKLLAAMSPQERAALAQRLKDYDRSPNASTDDSAPEVS